MFRKAWFWIMIPALLLMIGCGGGEPDGRESAFISLDIQKSDDDEGDFVEAEMIKDVATTRILVNIVADSVFDSVDTNVGTIRLNSYRVTFEREDGGSPNLASVSGGLDQSVAVPGVSTTIPSAITVEVPVVTTDEKLFTEFAQAFRANPGRPITFDATLSVSGSNLAGDNISATARFKVQAAVFGDITSLLPQIVSFSESTNLVLGEEHRVIWTTANGAQVGELRVPFLPVSIPLQGSDFPVGGVSITTSQLAGTIPPGTDREYQASTMTVFNAFGFDEATANPGGVTITAPEEPTPDPVQILQFYADRTTIRIGESVNLNWVTEGGADRLQMLPDSFGGVPVDFTGKDPAFDFITITPQESVRPILRAVRTSDGSSDDAFIAEAITVQSGDSIGPPEIVFFNASRAEVSDGQQVVLFWNLLGAVNKVELFPINGSRVDVTDRNSFLTPPLGPAGTQVFTLVVYGEDGSIITSDVTVTLVEDENEIVQILNIVQEPARNIDNDDDGSFRFTVFDPERRNSSWKVTKIAGDRANHFPREGKIPGGLGEVSVAVDDREDNGNGFITFEISAYDDDFFGFSSGSTRAVELVTFETTEAAPNAPIISVAEFLQAGDPDENTVPGIEGIIHFVFSDPDTDRLAWEVNIVAGDFGGDIDPDSGVVNNGAGEVSAHYNDDPDTPADPVIFEIRVRESNVSDPRFDLALLRVDKGSSDATPPPSNISFPFDGLYSNLFGGVSASQRVVDYEVFFNGNTTDPKFFRNSDLSGEVTGFSVVADISHPTGDASSIQDVGYNRTFLPGSNIDNTGSMLFVNYFQLPGQESGGSSSPFSNGVGRWRMSFSATNFQPAPGDPYNLPATGTRDYQIVMTAVDQDGGDGSLFRTLSVVVP